MDTLREHALHKCLNAQSVCLDACVDVSKNHPKV